jgi:hypothetical protein
MKKIIVLFLALLFITDLRAENTNEHFGAWSEAAGGLRGRLVVVHGQRFNEIDYLKVYVELKNVSDTISPMEIFPFNLKSDMRTSDGKSAKQPPVACGGPIAPPVTLVLPFDSTLRINVSNSNCTSMQKGGIFVLAGEMWAIEKDDQADYFLDAALHLDNPGYSGEGRVRWFGMLKLPKVKIPRD